MKEQKRYIERNDLKNGSHLEVSVFYTKGGMSYFTGQVSPRGYYLSVVLSHWIKAWLALTCFPAVRS